MVEDPLEVLFSCGGMECVSWFRVDYEELEEVLGHGLFGGGWIALWKVGARENLTELTARIMCRDGI